MTLKHLLTALCFFPMALAGASTDPFLDAQDAFRKGQAPRLAVAAARLKNHALAPYIEYYQLRMRLESAAPEEINGFIQRHADAYIGDALRADRLKLLARKGKWEAFESELPKLVDPPDAELRCYGFEARRQRPDPALAGSMQQFWLSVTELPDTCAALFSSAFKMQFLPEKIIWLRARRQIESGRSAHARKTLGYLPAKNQVEANVWTAVSKHPLVFLEAMGNARPGASVKPISARDRELAGLALMQLGRQLPEIAARHLFRLAERLPVDDRAQWWASVATQGASEHHPRALEWFANATDLAANVKSMTDEQHRWRARAALRVGDFKQLAVAIEAMPAVVATEPAWVYWHGRALAASGKPEAAQLQYTRLAGQPNFYGVLSTEELGGRIALPPKAAPATPDEIARVSEIGAIIRSQALFKLDLRTEAVREWAWAVRGMNDRQLLAVAEYARRQHIFDRAISAAMQTRNEHDYELRYLTPYDDTVRPAVKKTSLDDAWVYGLMRQESRFINVARSSAGAQGLMQLMPATARWVALKMGLADYQPSRVNEIGTNVKLGTTYLQLVYESLDRHPVLASAAYNAGPGRARKWRDPERALEGAVYAETIPFNETRDYVKNVMSNAIFYSAILNGKPDSLKVRLGTIRPSSGSPPGGEELP